MYKKCDLYTRHKIVVLTQPHLDVNTGESHDQKLYECLNDLADNVVVRMHPRQKDGFKNFKYELDATNNMWELMCSQEITDDNVLIGECSTAQFTPFIIANKQPWLIFLFKIYNKDFEPAALLK